MSLLAKTKLLLISTLTPPRHSGCILPLWETHWFAGGNSSQAIWSSHSLEASVPSTFPPSDTCPAPPAADQVREESVQEALVPTCRGARGAEELEGQLEQLVHNSCGFCLLKPGPVHQGLRKSGQSCPSDRTRWRLSPSDSNAWSFPDCRCSQAARSPESTRNWSRASPGPAAQRRGGPWGCWELCRAAWREV